MADRPSNENPGAPAPDAPPDADSPPIAPERAVKSPADVAANDRAADAELPLQRLHPSVVRVWFLGELIQAAVLTAALGVAEVVWSGSIRPAWLPAGAATVLFGALLTANALIWPRLRYETWGYALREHDVLISYGVLWKMRRCVPRNRVQHVDIEAGPIDRAFGIVKLSLFTAGTISAVGTIPGLTPQQAEELREQLLAPGRGHA
jgi:hypothetical protein